MSLTIYTVSDPATVGSVMTSMAMFFTQDSWVGGALKLALICSLLAILAKGVLAREGLRLDVMLIQLLVVMAAFIPKTTVVIEQFDNNAPVRVVDDVPYAIAFPGAIAGAFALYMTQKIETVMSGVNGKYIAPSGELDPFMPARVLMQIATAPLDPARHVDPNLTQTLYYASRYCGRAELMNIEFAQTANGFVKFADALNSDGTPTFIYSKNHPYRPGEPSGQVATCADVATYIRDIGLQLASQDAVMFKSTLDGIARTSDSKRYSENQTGTQTTKEWVDLLPELNRVAPAHAALDNLAVANLMTYTILKQTARDSRNPIDEIVELQRDTGLFQWAKEESSQALMVTTTAPKFMDILFFIFIAATPIVMFVVAANPATGLKVAAGYVLFGLWTQSWIPMLAIINGWYQAEIQGFAAPGVEGLTPEYLSSLMRHVHTATIAASNMLQSAPYMMFAIMTGSMFAMSNMIAKAAPSGGASAGGESGSGTGGSSGKGPMAIGGGALVGNQINPGAQLQGLQQAQALAGGQSRIRDLNSRGDANSVVMGQPTFGSGGDVSAVVAAATETSAALRSSLGQQFARVAKDSASLAKASSSYVRGDQLAQALRAAGYDANYHSDTDSVVGDGFSYSMKDGVQSQSQAVFGGKGDLSLGGGVGGGGVNFKAAAALAAALNKISTDIQALEHGRKQEGGTKATSGGGVTGRSGKSASEGVGGGSGADFKEMAQKAKEMSDAFQNIAQQIKSLDQADKFTQTASNSGNAGTSAQLKFGDIANLYATKHNTASGNAEGARQKVIAAIGGELGMKLGEQIKQNQDKLRSANTGATHALSEDQIAAVAALQALETMKNQSGNAGKLEALSGMARLAAAAGAHDASPAISQLAQAENVFKGVIDNLASMDKGVRPAVDQAAAGAAAATSDGTNDIHRQKVEAQQNSDKGRAAATYGSAVGGVGRVDAEGRQAKQAQDGSGFIPQFMRAMDTSGLMLEAGQRQTMRPTIPDMAPSGARVMGSDAKYVKQGQAEGSDRTQRADQAPSRAAVKDIYGPLMDRKEGQIDAANERRAAQGLPLIDKHAALSKWANTELKNRQGDRDFESTYGQPVPKPASAGSAGAPAPAHPSAPSPAPSPAPVQAVRGAAAGGAAAANIVTGAASAGLVAARAITGAPASFEQPKGGPRSGSGGGSGGGGGGGGYGGDVAPQPSAAKTVAPAPAAVSAPNEAAPQPAAAPAVAPAPVAASAPPEAAPHAVAAPAVAPAPVAASAPTEAAPQPAAAPAVAAAPAAVSAAPEAAPQPAAAPAVASAPAAVSAPNEAAPQPAAAPAVAPAPVVASAPSEASPQPAAAPAVAPAPAAVSAAPEAAPQPAAAPAVAPAPAATSAAPEAAPQPAAAPAVAPAPVAASAPSDAAPQPAAAPAVAPAPAAISAAPEAAPQPAAAPAVAAAPAAVSAAPEAAPQPAAAPAVAPAPVAASAPPEAAPQAVAAPAVAPAPVAPSAPTEAAPQPAAAPAVAPAPVAASAPSDAAPQPAAAPAVAPAPAATSAAPEAAPQPAAAPAVAAAPAAVSAAPEAAPQPAAAPAVAPAPVAASAPSDAAPQPAAAPAVAPAPAATSAAPEAAPQPAAAPAVAPAPVAASAPSDAAPQPAAAPAVAPAPAAISAAPEAAPQPAAAPAVAAAPAAVSAAPEAAPQPAAAPAVAPAPAAASASSEAAPQPAAAPAVAPAPAAASAPPEAAPQPAAAPAVAPAPAAASASSEAAPQSAAAPAVAPAPVAVSAQPEAAPQSAAAPAVAPAPVAVSAQPEAAPQPAAAPAVAPAPAAASASSEAAPQSAAAPAVAPAPVAVSAQPEAAPQSAAAPAVAPAPVAVSAQPEAAPQPAAAPAVATAPATVSAPPEAAPQPAAAPAVAPAPVAVSAQPEAAPQPAAAPAVAPAPVAVSAPSEAAPQQAAAPAVAPAPVASSAPSEAAPQQAAAPAVAAAPAATTAPSDAAPQQASAPAPQQPTAPSVETVPGSGGASSGASLPTLGGGGGGVLTGGGAANGWGGGGAAQPNSQPQQGNGRPQQIQGRQGSNSRTIPGRQ